MYLYPKDPSNYVSLFVKLRLPGVPVLLVPLGLG